MRLLVVAAAMLSLAQDPKAKTPSWSEFGGGPGHTNAYEGRMPAELSLAWKQPMGCPMPGRAQFVAGGGLLYGSSP